MRLLSQVFQPLISIPRNAKIKSTEITCKSQKLLVECGLIRPTSSGLFTILPLARRVLDKLESHIRKHLEAVGAQRISFPSLTSAALWKTSGRLEDAGPELIKVTDRHNKQYILSPTHEEAVVDLMADIRPVSYKQLPLLLYQISNKYRDEHRPKHGLLRAREFSMMDAYSLHSGAECAAATYTRLCEAYQNIFRELADNVYKVQAPPGAMGGSLSHEWQLPCGAGEDELSVCQACHTAELGCHGKCGKCGGDVQKVSSVEVGHTFVLGTRYTAPLNALAISPPSTHSPPSPPSPPSSPSSPIHMACYGIGVTRVMAACVDAASEDKIRWPSIIAPFGALIVGPKEGSKEWARHGWSEIERVYHVLSQIPALKDDIMIDDRHDMTIGKRMLQADKMGYPIIIVCGRASLESPPRYELHQVNTTPQVLTLPEICAYLDKRNTSCIEELLKIKFKKPFTVL